jgi:hypothetical protein
MKWNGYNLNYIADRLEEAGINVVGLSGPELVKLYQEYFEHGTAEGE